MASQVTNIKRSYGSVRPVPSEEGEVDDDDVVELVGTFRQSVELAAFAAFSPDIFWICSEYFQDLVPLISPSCSGSV